MLLKCIHIGVVVWLLGTLTAIGYVLARAWDRGSWVEWIFAMPLLVFDAAVIFAALVNRDENLRG